ncbi:MAG: hypothetical protein EBU90_27220 [Proteobacteria bacterium]|nr:hypothetical protein [Pseudomonadota bacterium]
MKVIKVVQLVLNQKAANKIHLNKLGEMKVKTSQGKWEKVQINQLITRLKLFRLLLHKVLLTKRYSNELQNIIDRLIISNHVT